MKPWTQSFFTAAGRFIMLVLLLILLTQTQPHGNTAQAEVSTAVAIEKPASQREGPNPQRQTGVETIVAPNATVTQIGPQQYRASISLLPRFYQDGQGKWQAVEAGLTPATLNGQAGFVSDKGIAQVWLPQRPGNSAIRLRGTVYVEPDAPTSPAVVQENTGLVTAQLDTKNRMTPPITDAVLIPDTAIQPAAMGPATPLTSHKTLKAPPQLASMAAEPLIKLSGEVAWLPLELELVDGRGQHQTMGAPALVTGNSLSNTLTYAEVWPEIDEQFVAQPYGLKHTLILNSAAALPASNLDSDAYLMYRGILTLTRGLHLHANGAEQAGDFATAGAIELRDEQGHTMMTLPPAFAVDASPPELRQYTQGQYVVQRRGEQILLAFGVPLAWLRDSSRRYPITVDPTIGITPPLADTYIHNAYPTLNFGNWDQSWIAENTRSMAQWDVTAAVVPSMAMIDAAYGFLFQIFSEGLPTASVTLHQILEPWNEYEATWLNRTSTTPWNSPGGDFVSVPESNTQMDTNLGWFGWNLTDLNAEWHSNNRPNYGVLISATASSPDTFKHVFSTRENSSNPPQLDIYYTLGPIAAAAYTPIQRGVPSPDLYSFSPVSGWNGFALRPPPSSDYDLDLFSDASYLSFQTGSYALAGQLDYVLVDRNHAPNQPYYPRIRQFALDRGQYTAEFAPSTSLLSEGVHEPFSMGNNDVMRVWDVDLVAGKTYTFVVQPLTDTLDIAIALHKSEPLTTTSWYQNAFNAVATTDSGINRGAGRTEFIRYIAPATDRYGLVVFSKGVPVDNSQYRIYIDSTPPTGSFGINNGAAATNNANVTFNANASDAQVGMSYMRYNNTPLDRVLVLQDENPWGRFAIEDELSRNSIPYDVKDSSVMTTVNLSAYALVVVPSVQPDQFCATFNNNLSRFASYVQNGGTLQIHIGRYIPHTCRYNLPDGVSSETQFINTNSVALASHPIAMGLPSVIFGNSASHGYFTNLPADTQTILTEGSTGLGNPTLIQYRYGNGHVIASGVAQEYYFLDDVNYGLAYYHLLQNMLRYSYGMTAFVTGYPSLLTGSDGTKTAYGWYQNNAGQWSAMQQDGIVLDTATPTSSASAASLTLASPIAVAWSANDSLSGVSEVQLWARYESGAWVPTGQTQTGTTGTFNFVPTSGDGTYHFATQAVDRAGNTQVGPAGNGDTAILYDTTAPSSSFNVTSPTHVSPIVIPWLANDTLSGIGQVQLWVRLGSGAWVNTGLMQSGTSGTFNYTPSSGDGAYYFATRALDGAGNIEAAPPGNGGTAVIYDTTLPTSFASAPATYSSTDTPIPVTWTSNDATSGVSQVHLWARAGTGRWADTGLSQTGTSGTFNYMPSAGKPTYYFATVAVDAAGNSELPPNGSGDSGDTNTHHTANSGIYLPVALTRYVSYFTSSTEQESNNSSGQANGNLISGRTYTGFFNDTYDVYRIELATVGNLKVDLTAPAALDRHTQLFVSYQTTLKQLPGSPIVQAPYSLNFSSLPAGTYYISVYTDPAYFNPAASYQLIVTYP